MKIYIKIKFKADVNRIESFGDWRYLVYIKLAGDDPEAFPFFVRMFAKHLGTDPKRLRYLGKRGDEHIFEI